MFRMNVSMVARRASAQLSARAITRPAPVARMMPAMARLYSSANGLDKTDVEDRIIKVFRAFDKITDASKITSSANFASELGLDSLDTVEVIVAVEEEFGIEIPDNDADEIKSVGDAVQYILAQPEAR